MHRSASSSSRLARAGSEQIMSEKQPMKPASGHQEASWVSVQPVQHYPPNQLTADSSRRKQRRRSEREMAQDYSIIYLAGNEENCRPGYTKAGSAANSQTGSLRSSGDSSGFLSESSAVSQASSGCRSPTTRHQNRPVPSRTSRETQTRRQRHRISSSSSPVESAPTSQGINSRVIDDLGRLMANIKQAAGSQTPGAPHESSTIQSLARGRPRQADLQQPGQEFDYSTLCRDEFSSYIATRTDGVVSAQSSAADVPVPSATRKHGDARRAGPMLVGVHELEHRRPDSTSSSVSESAGSGLSSSPRGHSVSLSPSPDSSETEQPELCANFDMSSSCLMPSHEELSRQEARRDLSGMLDTYLDRMDCLLRLIQGDKSVSMEDAFGERKHEVSVEPVRLEHALNEKRLPCKVVQEMEMALDEDTHERVRVTRTTREDFLQLLSSPRTDAQLDWFTTELQDKSCQAGGRAQSEAALREKLERSLMVSLADMNRRGGRRADGGSTNHSNRHWSGDNNGQDNYTTKLDVNQQDNLVISTVRRHLSEFMQSYAAYQSELKARTSFANDWHQNWLFAFKRDHQQHERRHSDEAGSATQPKRAKMSGSKVDNESDEGQLDLLKYSTLLLSKHRPIRLTWPAESEESEDLLAHVYSAQRDLFGTDEPQSHADKAERPVDLCGLLLKDSYDSDREEDASEPSNSRRARRRLVVRYSSPACETARGGAGSLKFSAHGYHFSCALAASAAALSEARHRRLQEVVLERMRLHLTRSSVSRQQVPAEERARFVIGVNGTLEMISRPPVIQFCAKVSGGLPMSARWFKQVDETSEWLEISDTRNRRQLRNRKGALQDLCGEGASIWPVQARASYDFEYQNDWLSWYRFRREREQLIFEMREPSLDRDYGRAYKCVIQNRCSRAESRFELKLDGREPAQTSAGLMHNDERAGANVGAKRALLRTWSQRTLHRPPPSTTSRRGESTAELEARTSAACYGDERVAGEQTTASLRSTLSRRPPVVAGTDKLGADFPYHPENLLKRLEANKFSTVKLASTGLQRATLKNDRKCDHEMQFTQIFEPLCIDEPQSRPAPASQQQRPVPQSASPALNGVAWPTGEKKVPDTVQSETRADDADATQTPPPRLRASHLSAHNDERDSSSRANAGAVSGLSRLTAGVAVKPLVSPTANQTQLPQITPNDRSQDDVYRVTPSRKTSNVKSLISKFNLT